MKSIKLLILSICLLSFQSIFANNTKTSERNIVKYKVSVLVPQLNCMQRAMLQIEIGTNIAYQTLIQCGPNPSCTQAFTNTINTLNAFVESSFDECSGIRNI